MVQQRGLIAMTTAPGTAEPLAYHHDGVTLQGELYRPEGVGNGRAMLVVHEADGIGGNVRRRCEMLAELGYVALAADIHGAGRPLVGEEMFAALTRFRSDPDLFRGRVRSGFDALAAVPGAEATAIAAIGYCFGGMAVLELARSGAPVRAVGSFHGLLTTDRPAEAGGIKARVAAFTGARDPLVPPEDVAAFQAEMTAAEAEWQLSVYGQALHSFTNPAVDAMDDPRMRYDAQADRQSWGTLLAFLDDAFAEG
jgi:dienelactone hydrolase